MKDKDLRGLKGIMGLVCWFIVTRYNDIPLQILGIDTDATSNAFVLTYSLCCEFLSIFIIYLLFKKEIKSMFQKFKQNSLGYFDKYFKYWYVALAFMMFFNFIIVSIDSTSIANNQEAINRMFVNFPLYTFLVTVIFAPVIEEFVFRHCFRNIFNNKWVYIILSGTVFGLFHIIGSFENAFEFLYIIPYSIPGIVFAYVYTKSENIFVPVFLHYVHNGVLMALQFLVLFYSGM